MAPADKKSESDLVVGLLRDSWDLLGIRPFREKDLEVFLGSVKFRLHSASTHVAI